MKSLTEPQIKALKRVANATFTINCIPFRTGEALRVRGYLDRLTDTVVKCEYVTKDARTVQSYASRRKPHFKHEWYVTVKGYQKIEDLEIVTESV